jgi:hypothetical protein
MPDCLQSIHFLSRSAMSSDVARTERLPVCDREALAFTISASPLRCMPTTLGLSLALAFVMTQRAPAPLVPNSPPGQPKVHSGMQVVQNWPCATPPKGKMWRDGVGHFRTLAELRSILQAHNTWSWTSGASGARADLSNAQIWCTIDAR